MRVFVLYLTKYTSESVACKPHADSLVFVTFWNVFESIETS